MKRTHKMLLTLALFTAGAITVQAEQDETTKTFAIKPGGKLVMNVDRGSIHVTTSDSEKVEVRITRELKDASAAEAKRVFEQHKIELTSTDQEVKIEATSPPRSSGLKNLFNRMQVDYTIAIPARFDIALKTAGGHIEVANLQGKADVHTAGGNLNLATIKGPLEAHTSGGHITVTRVEGDANMDTAGGNVKAGEIEGNLVAHTSGGHITIDKTLGSVKASTSGGNIEVKDAMGAVNARTSGGHVSARLNGQPKQDCSLKTSGGNVNLQLAANLNFNLNASTGGGRVSSDFPGDFNKQKTKLTAQINAGGPEVVLETSGGNVMIRKN
jgi:DUF4097 and DUF4098 domain-containing protein YvlB